MVQKNKYLNFAMNKDIYIKNGLFIPNDEVEITSSRSSGAGGQHVNKTDSRITLRWNVISTKALNDEQKARVRKKLQTRLTIDGDLIINSSSSRSQQQNKKIALEQLAIQIKMALYIPKKRIKTNVPKSVKESRLKEKSFRSAIKKTRAWPKNTE